MIQTFQQNVLYKINTYLYLHLEWMFLSYLKGLLKEIITVVMKSEESYNNLHEETEISVEGRIRELMKTRRVCYIKKDQKRFNQKRRTLLAV